MTAAISSCLKKYEESIDDYMAREVLPHIPDAVAFFEENLNAKKPVPCVIPLSFKRHFNFAPATKPKLLENYYQGCIEVWEDKELQQKIHNDLVNDALLLFNNLEQ